MAGQSHRRESLTEKQYESITHYTEITCFSDTDLSLKPRHPGFGLFVVFCFSTVTLRADNLESGSLFVLVPKLTQHGLATTPD